MATPNKFNFYIYQTISGVVHYYYVLDGVVLTTTTKEGSELEYSPINWDDIEKAWTRSESMHGIINRLSNTYEFVGDGGVILKYLIFTFGYDVKASLLVDIRNDSDWTYEMYSDNDIKINLSNVNMVGATAELFDMGMASDFMANLDTPYEIPLEGSDVVVVEHEGTEMIGRYNYRYGTSTLRAKYLGTTPLGTPDGEYLTHLLVNINSEGFRPIAGERDTTPLNMGEHFYDIFYIGSTLAESQQYNNFSLKSYQDIPIVKVSYKASFRWRLRVPPIVPTDFFFIVDVIVAKNLLPFRTRTRIYTGSTVSVSSFLYNTETINISNFDIGDLEPDDQLYFCVAVMSNTAIPTLALDIDVQTFDIDNSRISIDFKFESKKSDVKGLRLHKLAEKTVSAFADGKYGSTPFSSNFLSNPSTWYFGTYPYRTIITNGNAIKGVEESVFKLSMKDIINDVQSNYGLGVGVNGNQLQIEPINNFYDDTIIIADLGELTDVEITPINDLPTLLVFGHKFNNDSDVLTGAVDFNTKSTFKSPNITDIKSKKEYVSPIVSSIYSIEKLRVSEQGKDTTGNKVNEDLYKLGIVDTIVGGKYKLNYQGATGGGLFVALNTLNNPYNVEFSPKNMWLRLRDIINSNAYPSTSEITFQSSDRYSGMQSFFYDIRTGTYSAILKENEGFVTDNYGLVWLPFDIKCKVAYPMNLDALLIANPYGKFKGTFKGVEIHFYLKEAKQKVANQNSFDMIGRLTPSTNLLDLIF